MVNIKSKNFTYTLFIIVVLGMTSWYSQNNKDQKQTFVEEPLKELEGEPLNKFNEEFLPQKKYDAQASKKDQYTETILNDGSIDKNGLIEDLASSDFDVKISAAREIVNESDQELVQALLLVTSETEDLTIRRTLLDMITNADASKCAEALVSVLGLRKNSDIQEAAQNALISSSSPDVIRALVDYGERSGDIFIEKEVGRTLAMVNRQDVAGELATNLASDNFIVFTGVAAALSNIGTDAATKALSSHISGTDHQRDEVLIEALKRIEESLK